MPPDQSGLPNRRQLPDQPKRFNVTGVCVPWRHYMVDTSAKIDDIASDYIDRGEYFTINRARQFGKTTTLAFLARHLADKYLVIQLSFESTEEYFVSLEVFAEGFRLDVKDALKDHNLELNGIWDEPAGQFGQRYLRTMIAELCSASPRPVVLMIDEVDRASDFGVFSAFLGLLRDKYLERDTKNSPTFQSVILAGVHDIKNLRKKIRPDSEHSYNSPWNIAADFTVDLSFSAPEIATMLESYEQDHQTGMDIEAISKRLFYYTNGYPFLVSRLCKTIDEAPLEWSVYGVDEAERLLLKADNTLFDDLFKNVEYNPEFKELLQGLLFYAADISFDRINPSVNLGVMYGILKNCDGKVAISNIVFETRITNYFLTEREIQEMLSRPATDQTLFIKDGTLEMDTIAYRDKE